MTEGLTGNLWEMRSHLDDARSLAEKLRSPILHLRVDELSLQEAHATGAWNAAVALGEDAVARARSLGQRAVLPRLLVWTALPLLGRGEVEKASAMVGEAWALAGLGPSGESNATVDLHAAIPAFIGRVTLCLAEGNVAAAKAIAERGVEMADRSGAAIWSLHHLMPLLGQAYLLARDLEGAERLGRRLRRDATRMDHVLGLAWADACDALVTWLGGDIEGGCTRLRAAADRLDGIPMVFDAARVRRQFAGRLAELGRVEEALVELRRAHTVFSELAAEPELEATRGMFKELEVRPPPRPSIAGLGGLTGRELEVSRLVAARRSNKAIARELQISDRTVTTHLTNIYRKLQVGSRGELVDFVREHGWSD
jgi:DNA-binding CsgD family transcriptional regulator